MCVWLQQASAVEEAFCGLLVQSKANQQMQRQSSANMMTKFWQNEVPQVIAVIFLYECILSHRRMECRPTLM